MHRQILFPKKQHSIIEIYSALTDLTIEKGFSNLTVSEIVARSGYNRATFYKYFANKNDLANSLVEHICNEFHQACRQPYIGKEEINFKRIHANEFPIFMHIMKQAQFYKLLVVDDSLPKLQNSILETIFTILDHELILKATQNSLPDFKISNYYRAYGFYGLIYEWINSNFKISPNQMMHDLITLMTADHSVVSIDG